MLPFVFLFVFLVSLTAFAQEPPRIILDQAGRTVLLPKEINRVIVTFPFQVPIIYALDMQDKLVGVDTRTPGYESFKRLDPKLQTLPTVGVLGGSFNAEELLKLKPDVVLCGPQDVAQMEKLGLTAVATAPWEGKPEESILVTAKALNREQRGAELVADFIRIIGLVKSRVTGISPADRIRVYAVVGNPLTTYGGDQYFSNMVTMAGGVNVAAALKGSKVVVSKEQLLIWNPEMMVVLAWGAEMSTLKDLYADMALQGTDAVKNKKIYVDPGYYSRWVHPDMTSCLGVLWIAKHMYPKQMADIDVKAMADEFDRKYFKKPYQGNPD
jgi:iron complex transport system substrate-binding protein